MDKAFVGLALLLLLGNILSFAAEGVKGVVTTTLTAPLSAGSSSMSVTSTSNFAATGTLVAGTEIVSYSGKTATTFTGLGRGEEDTEAGDHATGALISESTLGLITNTLDFRAAQSDVPLFGPLITGFNIGAQFIQLVGKIVSWDYSFWNDEVMGIPMQYGRYMMWCLSFGVVVRLFIILRSGSSVL